MNDFARALFNLRNAVTNAFEHSFLCRIIRDALDWITETDFRILMAKIVVCVLAVCCGALFIASLVLVFK